MPYSPLSYAKCQLNIDIIDSVIDLCVKYVQSFGKALNSNKYLILLFRLIIVFSIEQYFSKHDLPIHICVGFPD